MMPPSPAWVPLAFDINRDGKPVLKWIYLGDKRFVEPFWEQTIEKCMRHPFASLFMPESTLAEADAETLQGDEVLPPLGFVFHVSRCGSTLVSRLLATLPQVRVLSEAAPLDAVLRIREKRPGITEDEHGAVIRSVWQAMARRRDTGERGVVVKWDAWDTAHVPLLRRVFPGVPMVFLYRDPREVLASHQTAPGLQMVPGMLPPTLFGIEAGAIAGMPFDRYQAEVLRSFFVAGLAHFAPEELISYPELPGAVWTDLASRFGIDLSSEQEATLREQSSFSAKNPVLPFESDAATKQAQARQRLSTETAALLMPLYEAVEARRVSRRTENPAQPSVTMSAT